MIGLCWGEIEIVWHFDDIEEIHERNKSCESDDQISK